MPATTPYLTSGALAVQGRAAPLHAAPRRLSFARSPSWRAAPRVGLAGLHSAAAPRRAAPLRAFALDPDDYELSDDGYDSDDYELSWQQQQAAGREASRSDSSAQPATAAPAGASGSKAAAARPLSAAAAEYQAGEGGAGAARGVGMRPREALDQGSTLFLLFGAAIDVAVSRLQSAALAAGRAGWQAAGEGSRCARRSLQRSPAGRTVQRWRHQFEEWTQDVPEDAWGKMLWLWDRPPVQKLRLTISMANLSIRLPALMALVATQVGLLASQVSLPMLAPLLLGTGMLLRSIRSNASFLFPRIGLLAVLLWLLWFANSVVQNTVAYLRRQGAIDQRLAGGIITASECTALLTSLVILLSMLGVNVSALLLPAGVAAAIAAKDLSHNFLAGFFLFIVQPFKLGDRVAVSCSAAGAPGPFSGPWFEGVCERVDLRYTMIRAGRRRLMVPNSAFLTREFMVLDDAPAGGDPPGGEALQPGERYAEFMTADNRHIMQYMYGPPVHSELMRQDDGAAAPNGAAQPNGVAPNGVAPNGVAPNGAAPGGPMEQQQQLAQQGVDPRGQWLAPEPMPMPMQMQQMAMPMPPQQPQQQALQPPQQQQPQQQPPQQQQQQQQQQQGAAPGQVAYGAPAVVPLAYPGPPPTEQPQQPQPQAAYQYSPTAPPAGYTQGTAAPGYYNPDRSFVAYQGRQPVAGMGPYPPSPWGAGYYPAGQTFQPGSYPNPRAAGPEQP